RWTRERWCGVKRVARYIRQPWRRRDWRWSGSSCCGRGPRAMRCGRWLSACDAGVWRRWWRPRIGCRRSKRGGCNWRRRREVELASCCAVRAHRLSIMPLPRVGGCGGWRERRRRSGGRSGWFTVTEDVSGETLSWRSAVTRIMCVRLMRWPIDRLRRRRPALRHDPLALIETTGARQRVTEVCDRAAALGARPGMTLAQARALCPGLVHADHEPGEDRRALIA